MHPHLAYIQLGSNVGDRHAALVQAAVLLCNEKLMIHSHSSIYETAAWGSIPQPDFLNQILSVQTSLPPDQLMNHLLETEKKMGRVRTEKMGPRIIDLDILFYDDLALTSNLVTIPHPRIQERRFILDPMAELDPNLIHPIFNCSIIELLAVCKDPLPVTKWMPTEKLT
jgi:2-amino-4-hydroxy-6-hydroxymethyldihydropteridine diphosphokinase